MSVLLRKVAATLLIVAAANFVILPFADRLDGLSVDILFLLRDKSYGQKHDPKSSPTVVVAIDEETYRRPPFQSLPKVMWSNEIATVLEAVIDGGAKVVGFDVVFPTSVEQKLRGHDRKMLIALRKASRKGAVVLGKVQHQRKPISPFSGYSYAVGHHRNIRALNMLEDDDGVIRRLPLFFRSGDLQIGERNELSMAMEIASRLIGETPKISDENEVIFFGQSIKSDRPGPLINFDGGPGWIPSYSLADLYACAASGKMNYFRRHFSGKAVFIGVVVDVEDRKLTSRRFINSPEGTGLTDRCVYPPMKDLYRTDIVRDSIPGVFLHATGVNMLVRSELIAEVGKIGNIATALILSCLAAIATFVFIPISASIFVLAGALLWVVATTVFFQNGVLTPLLHPLAAAFLSFAMMIAYRFAITDKDKRYLRQAFSLYLPSTIVDRLVESASPPKLGGESRELTVLFSDIQDFTQISEPLSPTDLVRFLNLYLSVMTNIIEEHGGFVDKFIGDAVVGVFGAPFDDPDHALHAVEAAIACQRNLAEMQENFGLPDSPVVATRIGINTGEMLVGNIGSSRRFNYTVMGDAVNLAARLESANKTFGTSILVSDSTYQNCGEEISFLEIDTIRVVGRTIPVTVYEALLEPNDTIFLREFAQALANYREGKFDQAKTKFQPLADAGNSSAASFIALIAAMSDTEKSTWEGVTNLQNK
ncbi:adenylate/guanylate cyclase domain-containing protein [Alphaproteobacteria bacterium]|nr:adenylate/guanylate cyclase domain-containing protein [Alphaproteobacteria bacterium]